MSMTITPNADTARRRDLRRAEHGRSGGRRGRKRLRLFSLASVWLLAFAGGGVALAYWSVSGSGSGTAKATSVVAVNVTTDTSQTADLYPGNAGGTLYFKLDNANPFPVTFTAMTPGTVTVDSGHSGCAAGNITVASKTGLSISVPANTPSGSAVQRNIVNAVSMASSAPDACQGAVFTIVVSLTGNSA